MKRFFKHVILIVCIFFIFIYTKLSLAYDLKEYCPLNQGDKWEYLVTKDGEQSYYNNYEINGKEIINNIETVREVVKAENEYKYRCIATDAEGIKIYKKFDAGEYGIFNPPLLLFSSNADLFQEIKSSTEIVNYSISGMKKESISFENQFSLESTIENVDVPGGKFENCLKLLSLTKWKAPNGDYGVYDCTIWMASGMGLVKRTCVEKEYSYKNKKEKTAMVMYELNSAVVNGKIIGSQPMPTKVDLPQGEEE